MRILFLDDSEDRQLAFWKLVDQSGGDHELAAPRTAQGAIDFLREQERYDHVFLDHDLDETDPAHTGQVVAEYIALHLEAAKLPGRVTVHSWNTGGALSMVAAMREACPKLWVDRLPFDMGSFALWVRKLLEVKCS